jgi:hypothetical protein
MVLKVWKPVALVAGGVLAFTLAMVGLRLHRTHASSTGPGVVTAAVSSNANGGAEYQEYQTPAQVPGVKPCPKLKGSMELMDNGHKAIEVVVKMNVDVDGAPNAYGPPGMEALDIEEHAHAPKNGPEHGKIVGYMTEYDGGPPTVQGKDDPFPGYYVSQTDFADLSNKRMEDPRRYVDATKINYVVEGKVAEKAGIAMGDFATAYSCRTGKFAYAIVADSGNPSGAEGSLALVRALGYPINDGVDDSVDDKEIVIRYYPGTNPGKTFFKTQAALDEAAKRLGLSRY